MTTQAAISMAFSAFAACAAGLNLWLYWLRRSQIVHLWLAVSALGVTSLGAALTGLHVAAGPEEARLFQRLMMAGGSLIVFGFPRFAEAFLEIDRPLLRRSVDVLTVAMLLFAVAPDTFFPREAVIRPPMPLGHRFGTGGITLIGRIHLAGLLALFLSLLWLFARNRHRFAGESSALFSALCIWFLSGANDVAVGLGIYEGPLLIVLGYAIFLAAFSGLLVRRMANSMDLVERSAEHLRRLVESRTEDLRARELQLAHGEKLATIGTLAAGVAHEINTPIAFVSSNLARLRELRESDDGAVEPSDAWEILADCREGVDRIGAIVSELLDLAHQDESNVEPVDLRRVVESALPMVQAEARDRAELVSQLDSIDDVVGDERQLGQIVVNLVMNALQSIPPGSPTEHRVQIETRQEGERVHLLVRDTGEGIPTDVLPHIFDPFFTTKTSEGTGLGLAVTEKLVIRHRGQIVVESDASGTTVVVDLPAALD